MCLRAIYCLLLTSEARKLGLPRQHEERLDGGGRVAARVRGALDGATRGALDGAGRAAKLVAARLVVSPFLQDAILVENQTW